MMSNATYATILKTKLEHSPILSIASKEKRHVANEDRIEPKIIGATAYMEKHTDIYST